MIWIKSRTLHGAPTIVNAVIRDIIKSQAFKNSCEKAYGVDFDITIKNIIL